MHHDSSRSPVGTYAGQAPRFLPLLRVSVVAHGIFLFIAGGYLVLLQVLFNVYSEMSSKSASDLVTAMLLFSTATTLTALLVYVFVRMAIYERPERPILRFCRNLLSILRDKHVWALGIPAYFSLYSFLFVFSVLKANISVFQPFVWDETFDHWDQVLHFGYRPWELLQPVLGYPAVTYVLDVNYDIWFLMMAGFWLHFACFTRPGVARTRYLLSFFLLWMIGGGLFAVLLSSAGPCFYGAGRLGLTPDPYAELMAYLKAVNDSTPLQAIEKQDFIWHQWQQSTTWGGISAMPSMHNATALLFLLASRGFPRWVQHLLLAHVILVYLGSIHLAFHYAVDAYIAWIITLAIWYAALHLARWWEGRPAAQALRLAVSAPFENSKKGI